MKKTVLLFLIFLFVFSSVSFGQDKTSEEYYQSFLQKYRSYQSLSENYNISKSRHLSYQSVSSRADYLNQAKNYLIAEIDASEQYANLIRTRLVEATNILNYQENLYFIKLDDEITALSLMGKKVADVSTLTELVSTWNEFKLHYEKIAVYGWAIKSYIEVGSLDKIVENLTVTKEKINQYLLETPEENQYLKASKDKFLVIDKYFSKLNTELNLIKSNQKNLTESGSKSTAENNYKKTLELLEMTKEISLDYQNIIRTLSLN